MNDAEGSASINFAIHHEGIDMRTNFNIYDVDMGTGSFRVIREGCLDQPAESLTLQVLHDRQQSPVRTRSAIPC